MGDHHGNELVRVGEVRRRARVEVQGADDFIAGPQWQRKSAADAVLMGGRCELRPARVAGGVVDA